MPTHPADDNEVSNDHDKTTLIGQRAHRLCEPSRGNFVASSSDDLFHPTSDIPSSLSFHLPNVPFNPHPHYNAYNQQNCSSLPVNPSSTSYNNPFFSVHIIGIQFS